MGEENEKSSSQCINYGIRYESVELNLDEKGRSLESLLAFLMGVVCGLTVNSLECWGQVRTYS